MATFFSTFANSIQRIASAYAPPKPSSRGGGIADILANSPFAGGGFGASNSASNLKVWLGGRKPIRGGHPTTMTGGGLKTLSASAAENAPWGWSKAKQQREFKRASLATGQPINSIVSFLPVWQKAIALASQSLQSGNPMTPYDILDLMKRDGGAAGGGGYTGPRSVTTTSKSVDKISEGTAWSVINDAVTRAIGRAPTDSELRRFISRANDIASSNPTRTTTTTKYNSFGQAVSSRTKTRQGASAGDYELAARNMAATPESAAYQAATTYYNAFAQALSSPVSL